MAVNSRHYHYVPILQNRRAEFNALRHLFSFHVDTSRMMPLIDLLPGNFVTKDKSPKPIRDVLDKFADKVLNYWGDQEPIFVDLMHLPDELCIRDGKHTLILLERAASKRMIFIPVTGLNRSLAYQAAVSSIIHPYSYFSDSLPPSLICLRLLPVDFTDPALVPKIDSILAFLSVEPKQVDLLLDCRYLGACSTGYRPVIRPIPYLRAWRTFTIAGSSWPLDLRSFEKDRQHSLPRLEWLNWLTLHEATDLERLPDFGDYTILHPYWQEPPEFPNPSASIRYTSTDVSIIMRGESLRNPDSSGNEQYLANAQLLTERAEFCDASFSYGDSYIQKRANDLLLPPGTPGRKPGSPETWLTAGINHHITFVLRQLASLSDA